jgi:hypothetical protein
MDHLYTEDPPKFPLNDLNEKNNISIKIVLINKKIYQEMKHSV